MAKKEEPVDKNSTSAIATLMANQKSDFSELVNRMDGDRDLYKLTDYAMKDSAGRKIPKIENITRNKPQVIANHIISKLNTSLPRWTVKSRTLDDKQTTYIENFLDDLFKTINRNMVLREIPSLQFWAFQQGALRGRIATRIALRKDAAKSGRIGLVDLAPMDARYLTYETNENGLENMSYSTFRGAGQIRERYGLSLSDKDIEIKDHWNKEINAIFIGSKTATPGGTGRQTSPVYIPQKSEVHPNIYKYVPGVISIVPLGLFMADANNIRWHGESLYAMLRDTFEYINKQASIIATINMRSLNNPKTITSNDEESFPIMPEGDPEATGALTPLKKGEKIDVLAAKDITGAAQFMFRWLKDDEQSGGLSDNILGTGASGLPASQLKQLALAESVLMAPILMAVKEFYQGVARMVISQVLQLKLTMEVGMLGFEETYKWNELDGKYSIEVDFTPQDPVQDIANLAIAETARSVGLSQETIDRDILKLRNPTEEKSRRDFERMRDQDPIMDMYLMVHSLINERESAPDSMKKRKDMMAKRAAQRCIDMVVNERLQKEEPKVQQGGSPPKALGPGGQLTGLLTGGGGAAPPPAVRSEV